jgi:hypothetical protein
MGMQVQESLCGVQTVQDWEPTNCCFLAACLHLGRTSVLLHIPPSLLHTSPESSLGYFPTVILGVVLCLQVAVLYTSDYGYSDRLSQTLAKGITKAGVKTEMVDVLSVDPQVQNGHTCVHTQL